MSAYLQDRLGEAPPFLHEDSSLKDRIGNFLVSSCLMTITKHHLRLQQAILPVSPPAGHPVLTNIKA